MRLEAFAPAKVNLFLHVGPPRADGLHPLKSLAVFADVGDVLSGEPSDRFAYEVCGPSAEGLGGDDDFVMRALRALTRADLPAMRLRLHKALPIASGVGGGTADGAAALRLAAKALGGPDEALARAATTLGADGPVCLRAEPTLMEGVGEQLTPSPGWPELRAVLVNAGAACPTGAVYRAYDTPGVFGAADGDALPERVGPGEAIDWLAARTRNDLEPAATAVQPAVGETLALLRAAPEARLARMSGSGATCFALTDDADAAERLAVRVARERPDWWVRACRLGDMRRLAAPGAPGTRPAAGA